jgi:hypothetical protein
MGKLTFAFTSKYRDIPVSASRHLHSRGSAIEFETRYPASPEAGQRHLQITPIGSSEFEILRSLDLQSDKFSIPPLNQLPDTTGIHSWTPIQ